MIALSSHELSEALLHIEKTLKGEYPYCTVELREHDDVRYSYYLTPKGNDITRVTPIEVQIHDNTLIEVSGITFNLCHYATDWGHYAFRTELREKVKALFHWIEAREKYRHAGRTPVPDLPKEVMEGTAGGDSN